MAKISFLQPAPGRETFEVFLDARSIGLVWQQGTVWCADPKSTAHPLITEADRKGAVERLVEELGLEAPE